MPSAQGSDVRSARAQSGYSHPEASDGDFVELARQGKYLRRQFERLGALEDIHRAVELYERARSLTPDDHPEKPEMLGELGYSLWARFGRLGDVNDLERALEAEQLALDLTPEDHLHRPKRLGNLAASLYVRYERLGELDDLQRAIANEQLTLDLTPKDHPDRPQLLGNLATSLHVRYQRLGELDDLELAIAHKQLALDLTPKDHPDRPQRLGNLSASLFVRYEHLGELDDLEHAIANEQFALDLTPKDHPHRPLRLGNLAASLHVRYQSLGELHDLERAIAHKQLSLDLTPRDHPNRPNRLGAIAVSLYVRHQRLGQVDDLHRAVTAEKLALDLTHDGHPERSERLKNLGMSMESLFLLRPSKMGFDMAVGYYLKAATQPLGNPSTRLQAAQYCVRLLSKYMDFSSAESLLIAHSSIIQIFPEIVWIGHSVQRRYKESAELGAQVNAAISAFIRFHSRYLAIEWFEAGRSLVWSQLSSLQEPLDDLHKEYPQLALNLRNISLALRQSGSAHHPALQVQETQRTEARNIQSSAIIPTAPRHSVSESAADRHRQLAIDYQRILKDIRSKPGFEDYSRSPKIESLLPTIESLDGPVVFINVHSSSCDALALLPNGAIKHITLPDLTKDKALNLRSNWTQFLLSSNARTRGVIPADRLISPDRHTNVFGAVLWKVWIWIVRPIISGLGYMDNNDPASGRLPHVTWCPTGAATQLPLHAAGIYDFGQPDRQQHVFDFVVSSYTPSLSALLRGCKGWASKSATPNVLVVAQPATPGHAPLPETRLEGERVRAVLPQAVRTVLIAENATVERTVAEMQSNTWVHLACHGSQDTDDPTQSAFALHDGSLTLSRLMGTVAENAELAFLSACQTAVGDEKIPEESAHLAAGMLAVGFKGVVATMWSIRDDDAPVIAEAYYRKLIELRGSGDVAEGYTGAAYALHVAVKVLRERVGERKFDRWAPFVHFGV